MKIAYLECATGISGDMTLAALVDAGVDLAAIRDGIASLQLPGVLLDVSDVRKKGFRAKAVQVVHPRQHAHRHLSDITELIEQAHALAPRARQLALDIFTVLGQAEAYVHGVDLQEVHFHEVGAIDSIVDIVGAAIGFDLLGADQIVCGPVPTGCGEVRIDHGICAIPTPATAEILKGIPLRELPIQAELTTPTGAAIVRTMADRFGTLPEMRVESIGCGAGSMDLPDRANILRLFLGQSVVATGHDEVCLLETNLDDVPGELIGYTQQRLFTAGALDVFTIPIQMKKSRPGVVLSVICQPQHALQMESVIFEETGTLGIRRHTVQRSVRARQSHTVITPLGPVLGKVAWRASGHAEFAPEFEDCARLAQGLGLPLREVYRAALTAFDAGQLTTKSAPVVAPREHSHDHDHDHPHSHDH